jgi:hypothetical protein
MDILCKRNSLFGIQFTSCFYIHSNPLVWTCRKHCFRYTTRMEVILFPNPLRPGIGLRPKKEAQRPQLPQHARLCPVLEAGSSLGSLVYPPLAENEQFHIGFDGEGLYQFGYSVNATGKKWEQIFFVNYQLSVGAIGLRKEKVQLMVPETPGFNNTRRIQF